MLNKKSVLLLILVSLKTFGSDGTVRFYGQIVSPPCNLSLTTKNNVNAQCFNDKSKKVVSTTYNFQDKLNIDGRYTLSTQEISPKNKIVTINYN